MPMEKFKIKFEKAGLNTDLSDETLPVGNITDGKNFRMRGQSIIASKQFEVWATPPTTNNPGHLISVDLPNIKAWITVGTSVNLWDGNTWNDVTPTLGFPNVVVGDQYDWTSAILGSIPLLNHVNDYPYYQDPVGTTQLFQELNFSPTQTWKVADKSFKVIRSHGNVLFALNLTEGGIEEPNSYRYSHPAATNGLPFTWVSDGSDPSSLANKAQILGDSGAIVSGASLRDSFIIYNERSITILDPTSDNFQFRARTLSTSYGLINQNAIVEVKGNHFFIGDGDILLNNGSQIESIIHDRVKKKFQDEINPDFFNRSFVFTNLSDNEILFCIPTGTSTHPNTAFVFNYLDSTWQIKNLPLNTSYGAYGSIADASNVVPRYDNRGLESFATTTLKYNSASGINPLIQHIVVVDNATGGLSLLNDFLLPPTVNVDGFIQRKGIPLLENNGHFSISRIFPDMIEGAPVQFRFGTSRTPDGTVTWGSYITFDPTVDKKIDYRVSGLFFAWELKTIGLGRYDISGMLVEYVASGER